MSNPEFSELPSDEQEEEKLRQMIREGKQLGVSVPQGWENEPIKYTDHGVELGPKVTEALRRIVAAKMVHDKAPLN